MNKVTGMVLCLILAAGTVFAGPSPVITPVSGDFQTIGPSSAQSDCLMGNLNPIHWAVRNWLTGGESYKYLFNADPDLCPNCPFGFSVSGIHIYLRFQAEDVPVTFQASVDWEEAAYDPATRCFLPGPEICVSPVYNLTIVAPGVYDINLPLDGGQCPCGYFGYWYGISFTFLTTFQMRRNPDLIIDGFPIGCVSYYDRGQGWQDLFGYGFPGELSMYADIVCCSPPIDTEGSTWGGIKTLYR